jgi:hypothetical protein
MRETHACVAQSKHLRTGLRDAELARRGAVGYVGDTRFADVLSPQGRDTIEVVPKRQPRWCGRITFASIGLSASGCTDRWFGVVTR